MFQAIELHAVGKVYEIYPRDQGTKIEQRILALSKTKCLFFMTSRGKNLFLFVNVYTGIWWKKMKREEKKGKSQSESREQFILHIPV